MKSVKITKTESKETVVLCRIELFRFEVLSKINTYSQLIFSALIKSTNNEAEHEKKIQTRSHSSGLRADYTFDMPQQVFHLYLTPGPNI